jgi:hypothetical protein
MFTPGERLGRTKRGKLKPDPTLIPITDPRAHEHHDRGASTRNISAIHFEGARDVTVALSCTSEEPWASMAAAAFLVDFRHVFHMFSFSAAPAHGRGPGWTWLRSPPTQYGRN